MSRCTDCKYDKCVAYNFDYNEDCPYFVDRGIDDEI